MPNCIPYCQWQIISVDLIMELPQSHGYDSILVAVDHLSKWAHFIATMSVMVRPLVLHDLPKPHLHLVLGKFGLVRSQAIFAGPETGRSVPR